jgi:hypothetical protein
LSRPRENLNEVGRELLGAEWSAQGTALLKLMTQARPNSEVKACQKNPLSGPQLIFVARAIAHSLNLCRLLARTGERDAAQLTSAAGESPRPLDQACSLPLVVSGREGPNAPPFCSILRRIEARPSRVEEETVKAKQISLTRENGKKENGPWNQTEKRRFRTLRRRPRQT